MFVHADVRSGSVAAYRTVSPLQGATMLTLLTLSFTAQAYTPRAVNGCPEIRWASAPEVVLHTSELGGVDFFELLQLTDAMLEAHDELGAVGGSWARVTGTTSSATAFNFGTWFGDAAPKIHVGMTDDPTAAIGTTTWKVNPTTCVIEEAHIAFQDETLIDWLYQEPGYYGYDWWDVEHSLATTWWFQISYMHELLHAFGAAHSNDSFSMLNYGDRPFANRPSGEQIKPLPDDIEFLRDFYPAGGTQHEIAVLNTWYEPVAGGGNYPAAVQHRLCQPSTGTGWEPAETEGLCGTAGTTDVCPGDTVRVRFAVANYGTEGVDLTARMGLSLDDTLGRGDMASPTLRTFRLGAQSSTRQGRTFTVPTRARNNRTYNVLVHVSGTDDGGVFVKDWSPMRGTLRIKDAALCP